MFTYNIKITKVVDGDTAKGDIDLGFGMTYANQTIRFWGIDTPESRTRDLEEKYYGKLSAQYVKDRLIVGEKYQMRTEIDKGKFGRILGEFFIDGVSLNQQMIDENMAVKYMGQSKNDIEAEHLENRKILNERGFKYEKV
jgi:micrococcal nuclease